MSTIDPHHVTRLVHELHGYELDAAGAARCAGALAAIAVAVAALAPQPQFYEEPASLALVLTALAPEAD